MKSKSIINVNTVELLEEVAVNMVTGNEERRTLNEYWLDVEVAEDGVMFFVNVVLEGKFEEDHILGSAELLRPKEEYERWLEMQEE